MPTLELVEENSGTCPVEGVGTPSSPSILSSKWVIAGGVIASVIAVASYYVMRKKERMQ